MGRKPKAPANPIPGPASEPANPATVPVESIPTVAPPYTAAIDRLPIRRRAVVKALTDPSSPTFGNQTTSYRGIYGNKTAVAAAVNASVALRQPNTALAIREEIEKQGLGIEVRVGYMKDVLQGRHRARTVTTSSKRDDGTIVVEAEHSPRAQDVLKAVQLLDRLDGSDSARQAEARVRADALRELTKRIMGSMVARHGKGRKDAL
jgi:hypothetical protein